MKDTKRNCWLLTVLSAVLMSLPWLVAGTSLLMLVAWVPLLWAEKMAAKAGIRRFWPWHYTAFVLWNALTTFWIWNATAGGAIFAILANALQMSLIFGLFRLGKKRLGGVLPYLLLAAAWIAWERWYLTSAQISWPWLVLGNAFAKDIRLIQWYEYTGVLGGSLWVWACNLGIFGLLSALAEGRWTRWNEKARAAASGALALLLLGPIAASEYRYASYNETTDPLPVVIAQPNIDPYNKFGGWSQSRQNALLEEQIRTALKDRSDSSALLVLAPETFTWDITVNEIDSSATFRRFRRLMARYPGANLIFGAATKEYLYGAEKPSHTALSVGKGVWQESHNSALVVDGSGRRDIFHKSKLVVGVEMIPYPAVFTKLDALIGRMMGMGGVMGRDIGQPEIACLDVVGGGRTIPIGCAVCYESVYGEYCTGYVRKGAQLLTVITNDAWWGNTPGYRQHLTYSSLRAIETRRDIARCGNTGISALIDQRGRILERSPWWEEAVLTGQVNLNTEETFFVRHGDMTGRISVLVFLLLALLLCVRLLLPQFEFPSKNR